MSSKYGDLIKKAREQENQKTGSPPGRQPSPEVNLCVKVPKSLRQHWAAEAKRQGTTMTEVIIKALKAKFGEPDSQKT